MSEYHECPQCRKRESRIEGVDALCWFCVTAVFDRDAAGTLTIWDTDENGNYPGEDEPMRLVKVEAA